MIDFENPAAFFFLLMIPALYFLRYLKIFGPISLPMILSDWKGSSFEWKHRSRNFLSVVVHLLTLAGFVSIVISFANPVIHHQEKVYTSRGAEILFVIDVSPSMAAKDMGGLTRLDAAKNAISTIVSENTGCSVGIVEMSKDAAVVIPPTLDRKMFDEKLNSMQVGELGDGTAIGIGLSTAIYHFTYSTSSKKSIVLITDGENNAGSIHPNTAARLAKEKNISLYVLGIGTKGTVPLEYTDPKTGRVYSGYLPSNYDTTSLAKIALEAEGSFYEIPNTFMLSEVLSSVSKKESVVQSYHIRNNDKSFSQNFLMLAGLLAVIAWIIRRFMLQEVL